MRKLILFLTALSAWLPGQTSPAAAEKRQAILSYQLDLKRADQLLKAMPTMSRYVASLPDFQDRMKKSMTMTLAELAAQVEKDPNASAIVKENGSHPWNTSSACRPCAWRSWQPRGSTPLTSSPHLPTWRFAKTNVATLKPRLDAADRMRSK